MLEIPIGPTRSLATNESPKGRATLLTLVQMEVWKGHVMAHVSWQRGDSEPIARVEPLLIEPATPGGCVHAGPPGCGHFIKLVHDGMGSWI